MPTGSVVLTDINGAMLAAGRDRMLNEGRLMPAVQCNAEALPFAAASFDCVSIAFGLRNVTRKERRWPRCAACCGPAASRWSSNSAGSGRRSSPPTTGTASTCCRASARSSPTTRPSYRYLAESIRVHPDQQALGAMMESAGFERVEWFNLSAGVVALHRGYVF